MNLALNLEIALEGIKANKLRSALTMLGIIIGVAAVIVLMSIGTGTQATVTARISSLGSNLIFIRSGAPQQGNVRQAQGSGVNLTLEDAAALDDPVLAPAVALVAPETSTGGQIIAGNLNVNSRITGVLDGEIGVPGGLGPGKSVHPLLHPALQLIHGQAFQERARIPQQRQRRAARDGLHPRGQLQQAGLLMGVEREQHLRANS